jgi:Arc/MetJ family transcription regulator
MMMRMRTTVTLDPDVEALIRRAMKERGLSFKEALNAALRAGLTPAKPGKRDFVQKTFALGPEQNFRWDKALAAAEAIEDEELSRKLSLRK